MIYPKRILVSPLRFIGDAILTVPMLRELRAICENSRIDLLIPQHLVNIFERCPYITEILVEPESKIALYKMIKSRDYQLGLILRRSLSQALLFKLSGIKQIIGFDEQRFPPPFFYRRWGGWGLSYKVPFPPVDGDIPQVKTYLSLLEPLKYPRPKGRGILSRLVRMIDFNPVVRFFAASSGELNSTGLKSQNAKLSENALTQSHNNTNDISLELWADEDDKLKVAKLFNQHEIKTCMPVAVVHGTSASKEKPLQREKLFPTLQALHHNGYQIVALGAYRDHNFYELLSKEANVPLFNLCGKTTLRQSYAFMLKVNLLVSLDSAPVHMAAAAAVPDIVAIYGPTNEKQWRPYPYEGNFTPVFNESLSCRPCVAKVCSHNRCRTELSPHQILRAVESHINRPSEKCSDDISEVPFM